MIERGAGRPDAYKTSAGDRVPGVTTILSRFKESGPLQYWSWQQGYEQHRAGKDFKYMESVTEAADIGSLIHTLIECDIHGKEHPAVPPEFETRVISGYSAWRDWVAMSKVEFVATEIPLVSDAYRFGGTIDVILRINGKLCLGDWKSSKAVYSDYLLQLAAYRQLWEESGRELITGGFHLFRFSKEHGDFEHRHWPDLTEAWELFKLYLQAYELDKKVKARAK